MHCYFAQVLISVTTSASSLTSFNPKDLLVMEFLTCLMDILNDAQTKPSLAQKTLLLLRNLGMFHKLSKSLIIDRNHFSVLQTDPQ